MCRFDADARALVLAQTPQVFRIEVLREAFERAKRDEYYGTDESSLVERLETSGGRSFAAPSATSRSRDRSTWRWRASSSRKNRSTT